MPRPLNRTGHSGGKGSLRQRCLSIRFQIQLAYQPGPTGRFKIDEAGEIGWGSTERFDTKRREAVTSKPGLAVSAMVCTAGNTAERFAEVTASGRSEFPVMRPMAPETVLKLKSIVPPNSAMFAGREPGK